MKIAQGAYVAPTLKKTTTNPPIIPPVTERALSTRLRAVKSQSCLCVSRDRSKRTLNLESVSIWSNVFLVITLFISVPSIV